MSDDLFSNDDLFASIEDQNSIQSNKIHNMKLNIAEKSTADRQIARNKKILKAAQSQLSELNQIRQNIFPTDDTYNGFLDQMKQRVSESEQAQKAVELLQPLFDQSFQTIKVNTNTPKKYSRKSVSPSQITAPSQTTSRSYVTKTHKKTSRSQYTPFIPGAPIAHPSPAVEVKTKRRIDRDLI